MMKLFSKTPPESTSHQRSLITHCYGCTRTVFLIGSYAIKIPRLWDSIRFVGGLMANLQEQEFWKCQEMRHHLAPVLFCAPFGIFLVMQRARAMSKTEFAALDYGEWIKGGQVLPKGEWVIPVENKPSSFGYLDGRLVAVDYGS